MGGLIPAENGLTDSSLIGRLTDLVLGATGSEWKITWRIRATYSPEPSFMIGFRKSVLGVISFNVPWQRFVGLVVRISAAH
jgi:hypothetical protein